jgi:3-dehydroquinate synthase
VKYSSASYFGVESAQDLASRRVPGSVQNPAAAMHAFVGEGQFGAVTIEFRAPLNEFFDTLRGFLQQRFDGVGIAQAIACAERVLQMKMDFVFVTERRGRAALCRWRGGAVDLPFVQDDHSACSGQLNGCPQPGNAGANHQEIGFGWRALHKRKMLSRVPARPRMRLRYDENPRRSPTGSERLRGETMTRVTIRIPPRPYEAVIESGLLPQAGAHLRGLLSGREHLFVVTVPPVRRKWGKKLMASLSAAGFRPQLVEMHDGERYKQLATIEELSQKLIRLGADRNAVVLAFGGGVVGDVAGLLASLYMRGVDVVQIPTTLLAQVDASIGGKTAVNLRGGKNLLGTFHQPRAVLIDPAVLATLPEREFCAGLYEALKCGVIGNPELFRRLENIQVKQLRSDGATLEWVIAESVKLKAEVVSADERERGLRRVLNFGHTIGHALEAETGYRRFLHGEAIAWGMIAAAHIAATVGRIDLYTASRISDAVIKLGPLPKVEVRSRNIVRFLRADKKTRDGIMHLVLPREIGKVEIVNDVPEQVVIETVDELRRLSK